MPQPLPEDDVRSIVHDLTSSTGFTERDAEYKQNRALVYRDQERRPKIPGLNLQTTWMSPEILTDALWYQRRFGGAKMRLRVSAQKEGRRAEDTAARVKSWLDRHHTAWQADGKFQRQFFDMATLGLAVRHYTIVPDALPPVPTQGEAEDPAAYIKRLEAVVKTHETPFDMNPVDPATIYFPSDWRFVVQQVEVPLWQLNQQYAGRKVIARDRDELWVGNPDEGTPKGDRNPWNQSVWFCALETDDYVYHLVYATTLQNAQMLGVYTNLFGRPGFVPVPASRTGDPHPLRAYPALLAGKYATVPVKNLLGTAKLCAGVEGAQQRFSLEWMGRPEDEPDTVPEVVFGQDGVVVPPKGYKIQRVDLQLSADVDKGLEYIESVDVFGFPVSLRSPEEVSVSSGVERGLVLDSITSLLDPPLGNVAAADRAGFLMLANAVQELKMDISIRSVRADSSRPELSAEVMDEITVSPDDMLDLDLAVYYDAKTQFSRIAELEEGAKLIEQGLLTVTEFQRDIRGIEDVSEWERLKTREQIRLFVQDLAVKDVTEAIAALRATVMRTSAEDAGVDPALLDQAGIQQPGATPTAGPSFPVGPGQGTSIMPQQPEMPVPTDGNAVIAG